MRDRLPYVSSRVALLGAALLAWSGAEPSTGEPPFATGAPLGHTGGFGEPTCQVCHADAALNHPDATLEAAGLPDRYDPGSVYRITVSVAGAGQERNGFQASIRFADGPKKGSQAGDLDAVDSRVTVDTDTLTAVQYASHTHIGAEPVGPERGEWVFEWTSPRSGESVVMHVAGNSANGDDSPFGDLIYTLEHGSAGVTP